MFDLARTTKKHGQKVWMLFALISLVFVTGIILWFAYRGDLNAQKWAKEWAHR
jgi:cytochrome b subunit of formate dehydrogenase